jgi:hypothetical protein
MKLNRPFTNQTIYNKAHMNLYTERMNVEINEIVKKGANYIAVYICILRATHHHQRCLKVTYHY